MDACRARIGQRDPVNESGRLVAEPVRPLDDEIGGPDTEQRPAAVGIECLPLLPVGEHTPPDADPLTSAQQPRDVSVVEAEVPCLGVGDQTVLVRHEAERSWIHDGDSCESGPAASRWPGDL